MSMKRWLIVVGALLAVGMAKVAQQTSILQQAYVVGKQTVAVHELERDTQWLQRDVIVRSSPGELSRAMDQQHLKLVAWSMMTPSGAKGPTTSVSLMMLSKHQEDGAE